MLRAGYTALRVTLSHFSRVLHLLFLQVTGVFFVFFAAAGAAAGWREYRAWQAGRIGPGKFYLAVVFALLFAWFAVSSFWRASRRGTDRRT